MEATVRGARMSGCSFAGCLLLALSINSVCLRNACAQDLSERAGGGADGCTEISKMFPLTLPNENQVSGAQESVRAELGLNDTITVTVRELKTPTDAGAYDSRLSIKDMNRDREFEVPTLIKGGEALRLFRAVRICDRSGVPLLILGFVAGWTDATQGFIVVRRSDGRIQVEGLPLASHGKLVVHPNSPSKMELWSAFGQGLCEACKKPYVVQDCTLGDETVSCKKRGKLTVPMNPNVITADIIQEK